MQIIQAPHPILSEPAKPVTYINHTLFNLIEKMKQTLITTTDPEGVGLAAPQIGKSLQLFIIKPTKKSSFGVFINPSLTLLSKEKKQKETSDDDRLEGCLSLQNIWGTVKRSPVVDISYTDEHNMRHEHVIFKDFSAIILQHEYDHLQGILFPKRVLEQKGKLYKSRKNEKGEEIFDPITL
jgi:peptide deformylase